MTSFNNRSGGFVLVAVIWVLASMALIVGYIAGQLETLAQQSFAMEADKAARLDRIAIESTALYLAATRTVSHAGIRTRPFETDAGSALEMVSRNFFASSGDELRLDNRIYQVRGGHGLQLQDAGSLVSLRSDGFNRLRKLLQSHELTPARIDRLVSTLTDYVDRDDEPLLNGAERAEYERAGLLPPTNRFLVNPYQLYNVMDWPEALDELPGLLEEVTIYVADSENFNTMTSQGLGDFGRLDEAAVNRMLAWRRTRSFDDLSDVLSVSGDIFQRDPMSLTLVPSRYLRMRITEPGRTKAHEIGITLTPDSTDAPWTVDYRLVNAAGIDPVKPKIEEPSDRTVVATAAPTILLQ